MRGWFLDAGRKIGWRGESPRMLVRRVIEAVEEKLLDVWGERLGVW